MQQVRKTWSTRIALTAGRKAENSVHAWGSVAGHRARPESILRSTHREAMCERQSQTQGTKAPDCVDGATSAHMERGGAGPARAARAGDHVHTKLNGFGGHAKNRTKKIPE